MQHRHGFTLIELSIVLVVIGLITGGVLSGQTLIRQAEIRSVLSDTDMIAVAFNNFRNKYAALPGDFAQATIYWPTAGTANGNGDGKITNPASAADWTTEGLRAWQHLSLAGMIKQNLTGVLNSGNATIGVNVLGSKALSAGFLIRYDDGTGEDYGKIGNHLHFAGEEPPGFWHKVLTPAETYMIDKKIDDGLANTGRMVGMTGAGYTELCTSGNAYVLTAVDNACRYSYFF